MWVIEVINAAIGHRLNYFGIHPRQIEGLPGIFFWGFLHGNFNHLIMNTTPLLVMGYFVALRGLWIFVRCSLFILVLGGLGVWCFGREAIHIGASGLVFGYFGFLVAVAYYERSLKTFFIACAMLLLYGGILFGVLPRGGFVSWEGHLFGLIAGITSARFLAKA